MLSAEATLPAAYTSLKDNGPEIPTPLSSVLKLSETNIKILLSKKLIPLLEYDVNKVDEYL